MTYTGGTAAARECIAKLTELGALVDVYSKQWLSANPDFSYFTEDELAEYQSKSNSACEGHLLVISTSLDLPAVSNLLPAAHPGFEAYFGERAPYHKPDLVFINLATRQILCVGLGRKNYFFGFAVGAEEVKISDANIYESIQLSREPESQEPALVFMREFLKYDYAGIVSTLIEALYEFGICAREWDHLPLNPEEIHSIISDGPNADGLYDVDGQSMTLEEAQDVISELERTHDYGEEFLGTLQHFFPELTWGDLNTQDY